MDFEDWLDTLPDKEILYFEETAREVGHAWAVEVGDEVAQDCFIEEDFHGNNPYEWSEDAVDMISTCCKREDEARETVMEVVTRTLAKLGLI